MVEYGLPVSTENCSRVLFPILNPNPCFGTLCPGKSNLVLPPHASWILSTGTHVSLACFGATLTAESRPCFQRILAEFLFIKTLIPVLGLCVLGF